MTVLDKRFHISMNLTIGNSYAYFYLVTERYLPCFHRVEKGLLNNSNLYSTDYVKYR
jgi:hypothetical protein